MDLSKMPEIFMNHGGEKRSLESLLTEEQYGVYEEAYLLDEEGKQLLGENGDPKDIFEKKSLAFELYESLIPQIEDYIVKKKVMRNAAYCADRSAQAAYDSHEEGEERNRIKSFYREKAGTYFSRVGIHRDAAFSFVFAFEANILLNNPEKANHMYQRCLRSAERLKYHCPHLKEKINRFKESARLRGIELNEQKTRI